jgi:DNA ligase (NAD+)
MALWVLVIGCFSCFAAPVEVERQAEYLRAILQQADEAYFNKHDSIMSDSAYDALRARYDELAETYPELSAFVAIAPPVASDDKLLHSKPVLSLKKAYSDAEVVTFVEKSGADRFRVEPKVDGLTVVLRYQKGLLTRAITRGDGSAGSDVTAAILASGCAPAVLNGTPESVEVRGEVFLPFVQFEALNARRISTGLDPLKSPRNTAAGTLRLDDFAEVERRGLGLVVFELREINPMPATRSAAMILLEELGFSVVPGETIAAAEVPAAVERVNQQRASAPFLTDGVVIKVDDLAKYTALGSTAQYPRGALARKYKSAPVETTLLSVEWQRGALGRLTPVAQFEPVRVEGATIQSATLHNLNHLRALDLMIGDCILVTRAGGSVPEIIGVLPERRTGSEMPILNPPSEVP